MKSLDEILQAEREALDSVINEYHKRNAHINRGIAETLAEYSQDLERVRREASRRRVRRTARQPGVKLE